MYLGVKDIRYKRRWNLILKDLEWPVHGSSNYTERVLEFLKKSLGDNANSKYIIPTILIPILENVHDHGSKNCEIVIGQNLNNIVIEVFEEKGGFDLSDLPNGTGGHGYREMRKSIYEVSHSADGRKTFIIVKEDENKR